MGCISIPYAIFYKYTDKARRLGISKLFNNQDLGIIYSIFLSDLIIT